MRHVLALAVFSFATVSPAFAVEVRDCDETVSVQTLAEPWAKNTRSFYQGALRAAVIDTGGEPVCCSMHLLFLVPDDSEGAAERRCKMVSDTGTTGFESIDLAKATTRYDAGRGLLITFPFTRYVDGVRHINGVGRVRVNVVRGTVTRE